MATEITRENDRMLTRKQLAERTGISYKSLERWAANYHQVRQGPPPISLGEGPKASVRYLLSDVIAWEESLRPINDTPTVEAEYERQKAS